MRFKSVEVAGLVYERVEGCCEVERSDLAAMQAGAVLRFCFFWLLLGEPRRLRPRQ